MSGYTASARRLKREREASGGSMCGGQDHPSIVIASQSYIRATMPQGIRALATFRQRQRRDRNGKALAKALTGSGGVVDGARASGLGFRFQDKDVVGISACLRGRLAAALDGSPRRP